jgi:hypothetical protein
MSILKSANPAYLYAAFVTVAAVALIGFSLVGDVGAKEISASLLASLGTFLGALFAFRLNESKDNAKLARERKAALNRALFVLARQRTALKLLLRDLHKYASEGERAFNLPAYRPPSYDDLVHNFQDLEFLLESGHPNVLMRLTVEQERFHQALGSLRLRNDFYVAEVQPEIARLSLNGKNVTNEQLASALGERVFAGAMNSATSLYFHFEESNKTIPAMHEELFNTAKELFPNERFVRVVPEA